MKLKPAIAITLAFLMSLGAPRTEAQESAVVAQVDLDRALAKRVQTDEASRAAIRSLLAREEVRTIATNMGVDLRRAESAVTTLEGEPLRQTATRARTANDALVGGAATIQISVVTLLLVIIIIILLAD